MRQLQFSILILLLIFSAGGEARLYDGTISGRVVNDENQPLANVTVFVSTVGSSNFRERRTATTDADGKFQISELPRGQYSLFPRVPGYVQSASNLNDQGEPRYYRPGETVNFTMVKGGVITGTITGKSGDPVVGVRVFVTRLRNADGQPVREAESVSFNQTDDRGIYRIYGLLAGTYLVGAGGSQGFFNATAYDFDIITYYPSVSRAAAQEITVRTGEEISGIDIKYRNEQGRAVTGSVAGAVESSNRFSGINVRLLNVKTGSYERSTFVENVNESRNFSFYGVEDGEYEVSATRGFEDDSAESDGITVKVKGADVTGITVTLKTHASIAGKVVMDTLPAAERKQECQPALPNDTLDAVISIKNEATADKNLVLPRSRFYQDRVPDESGEFKFQRLRADRYRFSSRLPEHIYVKSITLAGKQPLDIGRDGLALKASEALTGVTVRLSEGAASVRGIAISAREGVSLPNRLRVYLVPAEKEQADNLLRYAETVVKADGLININNLSPGKYWVLGAAIADDDRIDLVSKPIYWRPDERAKLRKAAEAAANLIELTPCQKLADLVVKFGAEEVKSVPARKKRR